ncbi:hypothetical protein VM636_05610 [Streptomyces sp. SCSIO 75703]|uniref:hypothetical protein n=1 Tax=unclassified Streptomyces TaxID=2593676 RepID=UPI0018FEF2CC|nr:MULTISPECIES: hypothetical protein [unclassified Streptomyces]
MRTLVTAATGLPTLLPTTALAAVVCFWLLVAVGAADVGTFDTDIDLRAWRLGGVPVSVALSVLTLLAWSASVGAAALLAVTAPPGPGAGLLRLAAPAVAPVAAWPLTCLFVRPLHRLRPDEPESGPAADAGPDDRRPAARAPRTSRDRAT